MSNLSIESLVFIGLVCLVALLAVAAFIVFKILANQKLQFNSQIEKLSQQQEITFNKVISENLQQREQSLMNLTNLKSQEMEKFFNQKIENSKLEIDKLIGPLSETINNYKKSLDDTENVRNKDYGNLQELMRGTLEINKSLQKETSKLSQALRKPTVRGRWGEMQLKRIVELSGMSSHCDFTEQTGVNLDKNKSHQIPDMVIHLPNKRKIIVDSKAILENYLNAEEAQDLEVRKMHLNKHALSLKTRVMDLSRKAYWDQFKPHPEFVVLFIPGESFFSAALDADPSLVELGFKNKVILATPTTLMALLKAVAFGWRQEQMAENAKKISDQADKLQTALGTWVNHLVSVGSALDKATKSYNSAVGSLERRVLPASKKMNELGAKLSINSDKNLPKVEVQPRKFTLETKIDT